MNALILSLSPHAHGKRALSPSFRPGPHDVICARGKMARNHQGNQRFREFIHVHQDAYSNACTKYEKSQVVSHIMNLVRQASPEGGFVKLINNIWHEVGDRAAKEKIGQSMRDRLHERYASSTKAKAQKRCEKRHSGESTASESEDENSRSPSPSPSVEETSVARETSPTFDEASPAMEASSESLEESSECMYFEPIQLDGPKDCSISVVSDLSSEQEFTPSNVPSQIGMFIPLENDVPLSGEDLLDALFDEEFELEPLPVPSDSTAVPVECYSEIDLGVSMEDDQANDEELMDFCMVMGVEC